MKCGDDINLCCRHWLSLLFIDLFLGKNELLLTSLIRFATPLFFSSATIEAIEADEGKWVWLPSSVAFHGNRQGAPLGFHPSRWCLNRVCWVFGLTKCGIVLTEKKEVSN